MKVEQVIQTLRTHPEFWRIIFQNRDSIVFAWGDYRFTRLSDRFNCAMMLNSKHNEFEVNWKGDDPIVSELYMGLVYKHLRGCVRKFY